MRTKNIEIRVKKWESLNDERERERERKRGKGGGGRGQWMILVVTISQAAKKSRVVGTIKENLGPQCISWYYFLGKWNFKLFLWNGFNKLWISIIMGFLFLNELFVEYFLIFELIFIVVIWDFFFFLNGLHIMSRGPRLFLWVILGAQKNFTTFLNEHSKKF